MSHQKFWGIIWTAVVALGIGGVGQAQEGGFWADVVLEFDSSDFAHVGGPPRCSPSWDHSPVISTNGMELYATQWCGDGQPSEMLVLRRWSLDDDWELAEKLAELNTESGEVAGSLSTDGRELFYYSEGDIFDIRVAKRDDPEDPPEAWVEVTLETEVAINTDMLEGCPRISTDGKQLFFCRGNNTERQNTGFGLWLVEREAPDKPFSRLRELDEINHDVYAEVSPSLAGDGTTLFFTYFHDDIRPGCVGLEDVWMVTRSGTGFDDRFDMKSLICLEPPVNSGVSEDFVYVAPDWPADGSKLYFSRGGSIWSATWFVDCNGDGAADSRQIEDGDLADSDEDGIPDVCEPQIFRRGDCNGDGSVNISDPIAALNGLFASGPMAACAVVDDINGDDSVDISDPTYLLNHLFAGGLPPIAPYPDCGLSAVLPLGCDTPPTHCP